MNGYHDPELDDVLQDEELRRIATMLSSARAPEPPLDDAFRTGLRRQLMQQAWTMAEGRGESLWRRVFAPPGLAWAGAAAGLLLIAAVVVYMTGQPPAGPYQLTVTSPVDGNRSVALQQPILVHFNQPMDHQSTEAAVQITPATQVAYTWSGNTLEVTPQSGNLAPNTQYQVTIGPGAKTATQQPLAQPQTITFVTKPETTPTPPPSPRPTPTNNSLLSGEKQLATLGGPSTTAVQWSADSSAVYFVDGKGALNVVPAKGGAVTVVAADGASSPAVSPAGDKLAYIHAGKLEVLTFDSGKTVELTLTPTPLLVGWSQANLVWAAADGVYTQTAHGSKQLAAFPTTGVVALSIAPDGTHVTYKQDQGVFVLDVATGKGTQLGANGATFLGWSPGGSRLLYGNGTGVVVADMQGNTQATLPLGDASWSSQDAILLGTDTDLSQLRPDGSGTARLANGSYHAPAWAPDGSLFAFFRGGALWVAAAPALPPAPTPLDLATTAVTKFMDARVKNQPDQAVLYLDSSGKLAYEADNMHLVIPNDPYLSRSYVLMSEMVSTDPDSVRFVVRLVLTHGKIDLSDFEETLNVVRDPSTKQFLIHNATATSRRDLGKGAEVLSVGLAGDSITITFDSDLDPATLSGGILVLDSKGKQVEATAAYANRVVTLSGVSLKPGGQYRLTVLTSVRDVSGRNIASEYDLDLLGPAVKKQPDERHQGVTVGPTPSPSPAPAA